MEISMQNLTRERAGTAKDFRIVTEANITLGVPPYPQHFLIDKNISIICN
jgi:hypothetical protein